MTDRKKYPGTEASHSVPVTGIRKKTDRAPTAAYAVGALPVFINQESYSST